MKKLTLVLFVIFGSALGSASNAKQFDFVALGDTAYNLPADIPRYESLIQKINEAKPAFSIHVGDTWGAMPCTREKHLWIKSWFAKFDHPLIYTPGDNEWVDCRKPEVLAAYLRLVSGKASIEDKKLIASLQELDSAFAGSSYADSLAVLSDIREIFFADSLSLGGKTMKLDSQASSEAFPMMAENTRWQNEGVLFATLHVPGSEMNFTINDKQRALDAIERNSANMAWLRESFNIAEKTKAPAVVLAIHASLFVEGDGGDFSNHRVRGGVGGPYYWIAQAIRDLSEKFGKPVLLINGDFHEFIVDQPFFVTQGEHEMPKYNNITRLQVFGAPELKAVRVSVDTNTPWVFSFTPLY